MYAFSLRPHLTGCVCALAGGSGAPCPSEWRQSSPSRSDRPTLICEMSTPAPEPVSAESIELPVEEVLQRARQHPPYGEMVIDDLDDDEADAFLAAVLS